MRNLPLGKTRAGSPLMGLVTAFQANYYRVRLLTGWSTQVHPPVELLCTRRSRLKKIGQRVMVGDRVQVEEPDWTGGRGAIAGVFPRRTVLDQPPIANVDQVLLLFAVAVPALDPYQLSRFLVKAELTGLRVVLGLSKCDLVSAPEQQAWCDRLLQWGYSPLTMSLKLGEHWSQLQGWLQGKTTVVAGPSGVGKSSLINHLIPELDLRVGAVSGKLARGRHTTRHVELFELPRGGLLADTPGFNQPTLTCQPSELASCFPEIRQRLAQAPCQFADCRHWQEPNCGVRAHWERYDHYLALLAEAMARQQILSRLGDSESTLKAKSKGAGQRVYEPKLASKTYRRTSRRGQRQALQHSCRQLDRIGEDN